MSNKNITKNTSYYGKNTFVYLNHNYSTNKSELVFIEEKIDSKLKIVKTISEVGKVQEFKEKTPDALVKDVISLAKAYDVNIDVNS